MEEGNMSFTYQANALYNFLIAHPFALKVKFWGKILIIVILSYITSD